MFTAVSAVIGLPHFTHLITVVLAGLEQESAGTTEGSLSKTRHGVNKVREYEEPHLQMLNEEHPCVPVQESAQA